MTILYYMDIHNIIIIRYYYVTIVLIIFVHIFYYFIPTANPLTDESNFLVSLYYCIGRYNCSC